jgi:hypothetical protein
MLTLRRSVTPVNNHRYKSEDEPKTIQAKNHRSRTGKLFLTSRSSRVRFQDLAKRLFPSAMRRGWLP